MNYKIQWSVYWSQLTKDSDKETAAIERMIKVLTTTEVTK